MTRSEFAKDNECGSVKMGEYNWLSCCRQIGHEGEHNYCIDNGMDKKSAWRKGQGKTLRAKP